MNKLKIVETVAFNLLRQAVIYLPKDVKSAIEKAYLSEKNKTGKRQLKSILQNIELAEKLETPICQDTGTIIFYVKIGSKLRNTEKIEQVIIKATRRATREVPLRPNAIDVITQKNSGDNVGRFIPYINWDIIPGKTIEITVMPKGGGSENVCALGMLSPGEGIKGLKKFVVDTVIQAGAKPCPPTIVGIGIGGGADISMKIAKKALLRPLDRPNIQPQMKKLEEEIFTLINMTGIGPMGLGGTNTVLGVHIELADRHPASYPVAIAFNCWASRRASALINADGVVDYLTEI